jgi:hypothetical protein
MTDAFKACPSCAHLMLHHDIESYDEDPKPACCVDGCSCGSVEG